MPVDEAVIEQQKKTAHQLTSELPSLDASKHDQSALKLGKSVAQVNLQVKMSLDPETRSSVYVLLAEYLQEVAAALEALPQEPKAKREQQRSLVDNLKNLLVSAARVARNVEAVELSGSGSISTDVGWLLQQVVRTKGLFEDVSNALN